MKTHQERTIEDLKEVLQFLEEEVERRIRTAFSEEYIGKAFSVKKKIEQMLHHAPQPKVHRLAARDNVGYGAAQDRCTCGWKSDSIYDLERLDVIFAAHVNSQH